MAELGGNRIVRSFRDLRGAGKKTLLPFLTAGHPDLETTEALLREFGRRGVRICELGIPFSDPIADGPVIQASYTEALAAGVNSNRVFEMVRRFRSAEAAGGDRGAGARSNNSKSEIRNPKSEIRNLKSETRNPKSEIRNPDSLALLAMVSYSIIFRHGVQRYLDDARDTGFDGIIVPDLPLDEAGDLESAASRCGLCNVMLISPTTPPRRRLEIAKHSRGFIYYISVAGITGERDKLPEETTATVAGLRKHTDTPICVGFGISNASTVRTVCEVADGAIVGSAIVHRIADAKGRNTPREKLVQEVGEFVSELLEPLG